MVKGRQYHSFEAFVHSLGFDSARELSRLIGRVALDTPEQLSKYEEWKVHDGTKKGLLKLERRSQ